MEVDIAKMSLEGLVFVRTFMPPYKDSPEAALGAAAQEELIRRGALERVDDTTLEWHLHEDTCEELLDVWSVYNMCTEFYKAALVPDDEAPEPPED